MPRDRTPKADDVLIGKLAEVTGAVAPGTVGEVMVSVRGGREAFYAHPAEGETIARGAKVLIIEYLPRAPSWSRPIRPPSSNSSKET